MQILSVLRGPVVTEKTTRLQERNKYVFEITPKANKAQVKEAVERAFSVKVVAVNITKTRGRIRRMGVRMIRVPDKKKAVVTVRSGDSIQFFEGA